jgi:hypothetical protein
MCQTEARRKRYEDTMKERKRSIWILIPRKIPFPVHQE